MQMCKLCLTARATTNIAGVECCKTCFTAARIRLHNDKKAAGVKNEKMNWRGRE